MKSLGAQLQRSLEEVEATAVKPNCPQEKKKNWILEYRWETYNIIYETSRQSRFDARYWMLGAGALGRPRGMVWGGRREEGSGWGTHVYLWRIHFDIWQNQYNIVKLKNKKKRIQVRRLSWGRIGKLVSSFSEELSDK